MAEQVTAEEFISLGLDRGAAEELAGLVNYVISAGSGQLGAIPKTPADTHSNSAGG